MLDFFEILYYNSNETKRNKIVKTMKNTRKHSIYTLADKAGVSSATVSKALNNSPEISIKMRTKIKALAAEYNFKPRVIRNCDPNICVLIQQYKGHPLDFDFYVSSILEGVAMYAQEGNIEVSIYANDVEYLNRCDLVRELRNRRVDGAVIIRTNQESKYFDQLADQDFPFFVLNGICSKYPEHYVLINHEQVGYSAVSKLIEMGHRKIGVLYASIGAYGSSCILEGYKRAITEAGLEFNEDYICRNNELQQGIEFGRTGIKKLINEFPEISAVFSFHHVTAMGALRGLYEINLSVPEDISLITFGRSQETEYLCPSLSSVEYSIKEIAMLATRQVHRQIRKLPLLPADRYSDLLKCCVVIRESVIPNKINE